MRAKDNMDGMAMIHAAPRITGLGVESDRDARLREHRRCNDAALIAMRRSCILLRVNPTPLHGFPEFIGIGGRVVFPAPGLAFQGCD
jgi:hypothetical protein